MSPRINRGARAAQAGPGLPHAPPGGAHLRPARLSPPSLHHSARCAHCSHRRLSNTKRRGGRGGGAADATRGEPGGGIQGCRMQWKPRPRRPRPVARAAGRGRREPRLEFVTQSILFSVTPTFTREMAILDSSSRSNNSATRTTIHKRIGVCEIPRDKLSYEQIFM